MKDISDRKALELLEPLLADDAVTEIMVDAPDRSQVNFPTCQGAALMTTGSLLVYVMPEV